MKKDKPRSVTVLFNTPSETELVWDKEADVDTGKSAVEVASVLDNVGYRTRLLGVDKNTLGEILNIRDDIVFNLIEWTGKDWDLVVKVFQLLRKVGVAYTGSSKKGYLLVLDKVAMKKELVKLGIPTPAWRVLRTGEPDGGDQKLKFPIIVKLTGEHCGVGISAENVVTNEVDLAMKAQELIGRYHQPVLAEEYIEGRELQVTVVEKKGKPWVLPPAEVIFEQTDGRRQILTYEGKWKEDSEEFRRSCMGKAVLSEKILSKVKAIARKAYLEMDGRDYPRLDIRLRGEEIWVLELNNNPGVDYDELSGMGVSARAAGLSYEELLANIVDNAYSRFTERAYRGAIFS